MTTNQSITEVRIDAMERTIKMDQDTIKLLEYYRSSTPEGHVNVIETLTNGITQIQLIIKGREKHLRRLRNRLEAEKADRTHVPDLRAND